MKWLESPPARAVQLAVSAAVLLLVLLGEPQCAAALARLGLAGL